MTVQIPEQDRSLAMPASSGYDLILSTAVALDHAHRIATAIAKTDMVPKHFRGDVDATAAAILYGATLGFDPMQSIRQVYVVHGQTGLYARSMAAVVLAAGHKVWTVESTDESVTVAGQRRGTDHVEQSTWTIERATTAGYVPTTDPSTGNFRVNQYGKLIGNEKYLTDPQAMLYAKALSEVCRKIAPDVLNGVYAVEEIEPETIAGEVIEVTRTRGLGAKLDQRATTPTPEPAEKQATPPPAAEPVIESPLLNVRSTLAKRMFAAIKDAGISDDFRLEFVSKVCERQIATSSEMTESDARAVIDYLADMAKGQEPAEEVAQ